VVAKLQFDNYNEESEQEEERMTQRTGKHDVTTIEDDEDDVKDKLDDDFEPMEPKRKRQKTSQSEDESPEKPNHVPAVVFGPNATKTTPVAYSRSVSAKRAIGTNMFDISKTTSAKSPFFPSSSPSTPKPAANTIVGTKPTKGVKPIASDSSPLFQLRSSRRLRKSNDDDDDDDDFFPSASDKRQAQLKPVTRRTSPKRKDKEDSDDEFVPITAKKKATSEPVLIDLSTEDSDASQSELSQDSFGMLYLFSVWLYQKHLLIC
jgi:hypothetical protein